MTIVLEKAQAVKSLAIVQEAYHKISSLHASTERDVTSPNKLLIHFFKISTLRKVLTSGFLHLSTYFVTDSSQY